MLYGVKTKRLKEQVKRNSERFPDDFMFEMSREEIDEVVASCDHLKKLKFSSILPLAFTEYGAVMAANVLNSQYGGPNSRILSRGVRNQHFVFFAKLSYKHAPLVSIWNRLKCSV